MRILRVVHRLYPPKIGGLSFYAHMLSAEQARRGHKVTVYTTLEDKSPTHEYKDGYEIFRFRPLVWPWENPITFSMLGVLLSRDERDYDILDAHSHLMFTTNLSALKRHISRKPLLITNHGFRVSRGRIVDMAQNAYFASVGKWTLRQADYVICLTQKERVKTVAVGVPRDKTVVIPNGVDTHLFCPKSRSQPIPLSILWTGRYVKEKGLSHLLQAARIVTKELPNSKFTLVGYGDQLPELLDLRRQLGLENNVTFLGPRTHEQIATLLNNHTLFALPSLSEGFPSSVLEAMSCEKPVVVTSGIGLEEVVGDSGLYVPPGNAEALATSITTILRDRKLAISLGRRGRERALKHYDWQNVVGAVDDLSEKAVQERGA